VFSERLSGALKQTQ